MTMRRVFYCVFILMLTLGCQQQTVEIIDADKLKELKAEGVVVVDIRTPQEYNQGHIPGVKHIDYRGANFIEEMQKLDVNAPVVIHCASGGRSGNATKQLQEVGFTKIYDYSGGFNDWRKRGEKIE